MWNIEKEKDREKGKVGGRPAKLNEKKGDRGLEREIKNRGNIFSLEEEQENFVAAVTKWEMLAATNAYGPAVLSLTGFRAIPLYLVQMTEWYI